MSELARVANDFYYVALAIAALLGFGFGSLFWWLVLRD